MQLSNRRYGSLGGIYQLAMAIGLMSMSQAALAATPTTIMAFGDSLMAGYQLRPGEGFAPQLETALKARGHDVKVIGAGVSGDTTAGGRARLDWALADRPDAAIVALGGNDGLRGIEPRATAANVTARGLDEEDEDEESPAEGN